MTRLFRVRRFGGAEWTYISICEEGEGEDSDLPSIISAIIGSALGTSSLHVQIWEEEEEEWEDLE